MKSSKAHIVLLEPFFTGSHQQWAKGWQRNSRHTIEILSLKGRHWKWRMYGGAVTLASHFNQLSGRPDFILATDMLDLTTFLALTRRKSTGIPTGIYFHENQITYPWSPDDKDVNTGRNNQYGFVNYTSALAADVVFFNSRFHQHAFLDALPAFLSQFPDHRGLDNVEKIKDKCQVLPLALDLNRFDPCKKTDAGKTIPTLLWNHRWEYDKNPAVFFEALFKLKQNGHRFKLIVLGESFQKSPAIFKEAAEVLKEEIIHFGYADTFEKYATLLWEADILPVTSRQDFFGGSVVEAIYCNTIPLLPRRLAYPEHLPTEVQQHYFYDTEEAFYEMLEKKIKAFASSDKMDGTAYVGRYDWHRMVRKYDDTVNNSILQLKN